MADVVLPFRPRRGDPLAYLTVQKNLDEFVSVYNKYIAGIKSGNATMAGGATTVVVTHNLNKASYRVLVTPQADPGAVRIWVSTKTNTQFTINASAALGGSTAFDWLVKEA